MNAKIWDAPGPLLAKAGSGHEPTLRQLIQLYYAKHGFQDYERMAQQYIDEHERQNSMQSIAGS